MTSWRCTNLYDQLCRCIYKFAWPLCNCINVCRNLIGLLLTLHSCASSSGSCSISSLSSMECCSELVVTASKHPKTHPSPWGTSESSSSSWFKNSAHSAWALGWSHAHHFGMSTCRCSVSNLSSDGSAYGQVSSGILYREIHCNKLLCINTLLLELMIIATLTPQCVPCLAQWVWSGTQTFSQDGTVAFAVSLLLSNTQSKVISAMLCYSYYSHSISFCYNDGRLMNEKHVYNKRQWLHRLAQAEWLVEKLFMRIYVGIVKENAKINVFVNGVNSKTVLTSVLHQL